jgi:hypothetical protein
VGKVKITQNVPAPLNLFHLFNWGFERKMGNFLEVKLGLGRGGGVYEPGHAEENAGLAIVGGDPGRCI